MQFAAEKVIPATLIAGDGIGPEIVEGLYVGFEHYIPIGDNPYAVAIGSGVNTRPGPAAHRFGQPVGAGLRLQPGGAARPGDHGQRHHRHRPGRRGAVPR